MGTVRNSGGIIDDGGLREQRHRDESRDRYQRDGGRRPGRIANKRTDIKSGSAETDCVAGGNNYSRDSLEHPEFPDQQPRR